MTAMTPMERAQALHELENERNFKRGNWFRTYSACEPVAEGKQKRPSSETEVVRERKAGTQ